MKRTNLLIITLAGFSLCGCSPGSDENVQDAVSRLTVRAAGAEITTKSSTVPASEPVVFTGNDILWYNETTGELRFINNFTQNDDMRPYLYGSRFKFYLEDEYLFSSVIYSSSLDSRIHNNLVFYYDIIENKFYLAVGYPPIEAFHNTPEIQAEMQAERDANRKKIETEWNRFIEQMKREGRYRNSRKESVST
ncbi:MAG: hypothetical protein LBP64_10715 [Tannerella sp.]|jgi:hypothetical protein|nr:hypothetical protein [Tannerella sp.]